MGALIPTTLPRSSILQVISIPYFCADAHFQGMEFDLSPSFTSQMIEILSGMREILVVFSILEQIFATCNSFPFYKCCFQNYKIFSILKAMDFDQSEKHRAMNHTIRSWSMFPYKTLRDIFVYRGVPRYDWRSAHLRVKQGATFFCIFCYFSIHTTKPLLNSVQNTNISNIFYF